MYCISRQIGGPYKRKKIANHLHRHRMLKVIDRCSEYFGARTQGYAELREPIKTFENSGYLLIGNLVLLLVPLSLAL